MGINTRPTQTGIVRICSLTVGFPCVAQGFQGFVQGAEACAAVVFAVQDGEAAFRAGLAGAFGEGLGVGGHGAGFASGVAGRRGFPTACADVDEGVRGQFVGQEAQYVAVVPPEGGAGGEIVPVAGGAAGEAVNGKQAAV